MIRRTTSFAQDKTIKANLLETIFQSTSDKNSQSTWILTNPPDRNVEKQQTLNDKS